VIITGQHDSRNTSRMGLMAFGNSWDRGNLVSKGATFSVVAEVSAPDGSFLKPSARLRSGWQKTRLLKTRKRAL